MSTQEQYAERLRAEIAAIPPKAIVKPYAEPRAAAVTAILVADYLAQPELVSKLQSLAKVGAFDVTHLEKLRAISRVIVAAVDALGGEWFKRDRLEDAALRARAAAVRGELLARLEQGLHDDEARIWLDAVRRGDGDVDLLLDLRSLVTLCHSYKEELAGAPESHDGRVLEAIAAADAVEASLTSKDDAATRKHRDTIARAFTLFVGVYDEVCRAGRFVSPGGRAAARFPMLGTLSRARRSRARGAPPPLPNAPRGPASKATAPSSGTGTTTTVTVTAPLPPPMSSPSPSPLSGLGYSVPPTLPEGVAFSPTPPPASVRTSQIPASQRRIDARHSVEMEVGLATESNFYVGFTENLSSGGVFVATYLLKPIGSKLEVRLSLPNGSAFTLHGTVRWVRSASDTSDAWPGMGIQFEQLPAHQEEEIRAFVQTREPIFFEE